VARGAATVGGSLAVSEHSNGFSAIQTWFRCRTTTDTGTRANPSQLLSLGFAFDIVRTPFGIPCDVPHDAAQDGVLLHGTTVLPEARRALSILEGDNPLSR